MYDLYHVSDFYFAAYKISLTVMSSLFIHMYSLLNNQILTVEFVTPCDLNIFDFICIKLFLIMIISNVSVEQSCFEPHEWLQSLRLKQKKLNTVLLFKREMRGYMSWKRKILVSSMIDLDL